MTMTTTRRDSESVPPEQIETLRFLSQFKQRSFRHAYLMILAYFACVALLVLVVNAIFGPASLPVTSVVACLVAVILVNIPTRVTVGSDGVHIAWAGWSRFVAYSDIQAVTVEDRTFNTEHHRAVVMELRNGRRVLLAASIDQTKMVDALGRQLRRTCRRLARTPPWTPTALLASSAESLFGILERASFRAEALNRDVVWEVLEDVAATRAERMAAAIALMDGLSVDERTRLKALADGTADPSTRAAFLAAASGDRDGVESILEMLKSKGKRQ
jgi:hypothetical protein